MKLLQKESIMLRNYMNQCYGVNLDMDPNFQAVVFPSTKRWLKGEEYGFLIRHYHAYSQLLKRHQVYDKDHPAKDVYEQPQRK